MTRIRPTRPDPTIRSDGVGWGDREIRERGDWGFASVMWGGALIIGGLLVYMFVTWPVETLALFGFIGLCVVLGRLTTRWIHP